MNVGLWIAGFAIGVYIYQREKHFWEHVLK